MTTKRWTDNHIESPNPDQFDYVLELALWSDCGITEYVGVVGAKNDELTDLLNDEVDQLRAWFDSEVESGSMDARTDEPQIAIIRRRPEADEDGEFPSLCDWPVLFDWN